MDRHWRRGFVRRGDDTPPLYSSPMPRRASRLKSKRRKCQPSRLLERWRIPGIGFNSTIPRSEIDNKYPNRVSLEWNTDLGGSGPKKKKRDVHIPPKIWMTPRTSIKVNPIQVSRAHEGCISGLPIAWRAECHHITAARLACCCCCRTQTQKGLSVVLAAQEGRIGLLLEGCAYSCSALGRRDEMRRGMSEYELSFA